MRFRMDWRSVAFDWNRARAFLVTAEEGSLSAAARALGMTQPTLGRQVTALEQELGVALLERGARGLELTPSGLDLLAHVRAMGEAANSLSLTASGQASAIEGSICITATEVMAAFILPPIIGKLRRMEPGIIVELIASNSTSDLKRREADIAIRSFRPTQPDLISRKLFDIRAYLYASEAYLRRIGIPESPDDLAKADFIGFNRNDALIAALAEIGLKLSRKHFSITTDNHLVQWELVKQGAGIGIMPDALGDAEPGVRRALASLPPLIGEEWLVAHRELKTSRRVRMVFDFLIDALT